MTENVHVVGERLIAYLYEEADAGERALVDAHLRVCAACAGELAALGATREHLAEWGPPDVALGFPIVRPMTAVDASATVLRPARWWNRPTPVWAHAAAAVLIFAAGLLVGTSRGPVVATPGADPQQAPSAQVAAPPVLPSAFSAPVADSTAPPQVAELAREVERLRADLAALASSPTQASLASSPTEAALSASATQASGAQAIAPASDAAVLTRVQELIADSEAGLRTDMTLRYAQMERAIDLQRRRDLEVFNSSLDLVNNQTGQALRQNERAVRDLRENLAKVTGLSVAPGR